ncbi:MAG: glutamine amidotransferase [Kiritimatiellaeota bacterium]|nr:glutamine amidotransferase [Kiritimatiellota bacterium]
MEIIYEHAAPISMILAAIAITLALGVFFFWRFLPGEVAAFYLWPIRAFFFLVLGWCLLMPTQKRALTEVIRPRFLIALDTSASMGMSPNATIPPRWKLAREALQQPWATEVEKQCDIEVYPFASELGQPTTIAGVLTNVAPTGTASLVRESLRGLADRYRGQPVGGLLLLSDGLDTREARSEWAAATWPCPMYSVRLEPAGVWKAEPDVRVEAVVDGQAAGQSVRVQLYENGGLLQEIPTQLPEEGGRREVKFTLRHPMIGIFNYEVRLPYLKGETHTNDNTQQITVQVNDAKNRLLFLEDVPRTEAKFLNRVLDLNQNVSSLSFMRIGKRWVTFGREQASTMDWTQLPLSTYKIIILGDLEDNMLPLAQYDALVQYVEAGGSLVLMGGERAWGVKGFDASPLKKVMPISRGGHRPIIEGKFRVTITPDGLVHPAFQRKEEGEFVMPPVLSVYPGSKPTAGAQVLVTAATPEGVLPLVIQQRYGQGRVVVVLSDSLWRWQLDPNPLMSKSYTRFWSQLIQALVPEQQELDRFSIELYSNTDHPYLGDTLQFSARLMARGNETVGELPMTCEITTPSGRKLPFTMKSQNITTGAGKQLPGYMTELHADEPGLYQAVARTEVAGMKVESAPYPVYVRPYTPETMPKAADVIALQTLARVSSGKFCEFNELNTTLSGLHFAQQEEQRVIYRTLWNNWLILAALVSLLVVEWTLRRWRNLA